MKRCAVLLLCSLIGMAQAAPVGNEADELESFISNSLVISEISHLSQQVGQQASSLVVNAMGYLGVPYRRGGTTVNGFDCSGFVRAMYENTLGLVLPHNARAQAQTTQTIDPAELQPGDLVFFNTLGSPFSHVGIYIGEGKFIHAENEKTGVRISHLQNSYWSRRLNGFRVLQ